MKRPTASKTVLKTSAANNTTSRGVRKTSSVRVPGGRKPEKVKEIKQDKKIEDKTKEMKRKRYKAPLMILLFCVMIGVVFLSAFLSYTYLVDKYENPVTLESI